MHDSASQNSSSVICPARFSAHSRQPSVPEPSSWSRHLPLSIGPPGHHDGGHVGGGGAHEHGRRGLVAAGQEHHRVERIRADALLDVHRHEVAEHHGGGLHQHFAQRDGGELQREAAGRPHAALHRLGRLAQMRVAVGQLRPRVGDADHRAAVEDDVAEALGLQPRAMHESVEIRAAEPVATAQRSGMSWRPPRAGPRYF